MRATETVRITSFNFSMLGLSVITRCPYKQVSVSIVSFQVNSTSLMNLCSLCFHFSDLMQFVYSRSRGSVFHAAMEVCLIVLICLRFIHLFVPSLTTKFYTSISQFFFQLPSFLPCCSLHYFFCCLFSQICQYFQSYTRMYIYLPLISWFLFTTVFHCRHNRLFQ